MQINCIVQQGAGAYLINHPKQLTKIQCCAMLELQGNWYHWGALWKLCMFDQSKARRSHSSYLCIATHHFAQLCNFAAHERFLGGCHKRNMNISCTYTPRLSATCAQSCTTSSLGSFHKLMHIYFTWCIFAENYSRCRFADLSVNNWIGYFG